MASRLRVKPAPYSTLLITENLPNLASWTILCHWYTVVGLLRSFSLLASALPIFIQLWTQDTRLKSAAESAAQQCSWDTHACPGDSCKCTSSTHTASLAAGLQAQDMDLQGHKQLLQAPESKRRQRNQHHGKGALDGLDVSVTSLVSREALNVLRLWHAGGSVQLGQPRQASHTNSWATTELQPLAAEGRTQQRNFQKKEFWWELISETTSL